MAQAPWRPILIQGTGTLILPKPSSGSMLHDVQPGQDVRILRAIGNGKSSMMNRKSPENRRKGQDIRPKFNTYCEERVGPGKEYYEGEIVGHLARTCGQKKHKNAKTQ
jgi:hypothetical protein